MYTDTDINIDIHIDICTRTIHTKIECSTQTESYA